jgi:hypothetical protein
MEEDGAEDAVEVSVEGEATAGAMAEAVEEAMEEGGGAIHHNFIHLQCTNNYHPRIHTFSHQHTHK